ncbi:hypothetical protein IJH33_01290 [Candidatus Saccharibacteria bacterium]|nr:hypothetical protein [Candidatus Saccharibacteria bacterium]
MKKNRTVYILMNLFFVAGALVFVNYKSILDANFGFPKILLALLLFALIHVVKFIRMYFVLLEDLIRPNRFLQIYLKTTFVSTLVPFKIGEIFKMYCYGYETNSWMKGILAVLIEKFFDAIVLCSFMLPFSIANGEVNPLLVLLVGFIVIIAVVYFSFVGTYKYLNRFLICKAGGKKSLGILKVLEAVKVMHDTARRMVKGRFIILLALSFLAWIVEATLVAFMNGDGINVDLSLIFSYVNDAFFGVSNVYFNYYVTLCAIVFFVALVVVYARKYLMVINRRKEIK